MTDGTGSLLAISDLHVGFGENRRLVEGLRPGSDSDWLLFTGDVAERVADVEWALRTLSHRFETVVWVPGNHELWTPKDDPVQLRGEQRYRHLVQMCRGLGVVTPERRLAARDTSMPTVLVNHFPLVREPTLVLRLPRFALWCGTERTAEWHLKYQAAAVVYGHLHIRRTMWHDGVRFEEVSLGYPREWGRRGGPGGLRRVLPAGPP
ncbi:metallophosphoesterase family protein [Actinomadura scrupuli]|uniref:metallophosphoesterase family protein n=1 Tax=Actinomadura scrupuli TaxID=559629 RepID=UPI003D96B093